MCNALCCQGAATCFIYYIYVQNIYSLGGSFAIEVTAEGWAEFPVLNI